VLPAIKSLIRVIKKLQQKGCEVVIPSKSNRTQPRDYDQHLYKARHLIENFLAKLKQDRCIATRYDKTAGNFLGAIYLLFGDLDDTP
jgi:transposase